MMGLLALPVLIAACLGGGLAGLRGLGLLPSLTWPQRLALGFALGFGLMGWMLWGLGVAGLLSPGPIGLLCALMAAGALAARSGPSAPPREADGPCGPAWPALLVVLAGVAVLHAIQAAAPPTDADSLGYHFTLPKEFLAAGRIYFVPRAWDGAVPLLIQLTYAAALALGGEPALLAWTMITAWAGTALIYVFARQWLPPVWALAAALVHLTAPVTTYGAVSGQVEPRIVLFVGLAAFALSRLDRKAARGWVVLAGVAAGLYAGSKYFGLLFCAAGLLAVCAGGGRWRQAITFCCAGALAGGQWYAWNWLHTGDPLFPTLWRVLGLADSDLWSADFSESLARTLGAAERPLPPTLFWYLAYPFKATLDGLPMFESGRTGLGPFALLVLPMAAAGVWLKRSGLWRHPLWPVAVLVAGFYTIWFFAGGTLRVRHLAPVLPLLVVLLIAAVWRWRSMNRALALAVGLTLVTQLAGVAVFSVNAAQYLIRGESRDSYLSRLIIAYDPVPSRLSRLLTPADKVVLADRLVLYFLDRPYFYAQPDDQALVDVRDDTVDWRRFLAQLSAVGATHILAREGEPGTGGLSGLSATLLQHGCVEIVEVMNMRYLGSRTLASDQFDFTPARLYRLTPDACRAAP